MPLAMNRFDSYEGYRVPVRLKTTNDYRMLETNLYSGSLFQHHPF